MERVSDEWLERQLCVGAHVIGNMTLLEIDMKIYKDMIAELLERRQAEAKKAVLPMPCTKGYEKCTVKQWFAKINEELDELKEVVLYEYNLGNVPSDAVAKVDVDDLVAAEASDVITVITSILEAMGIDEKARQAAQERVNERNRQRGRW